VGCERVRSLSRDMFEAVIDRYKEGEICYKEALEELESYREMQHMWLIDGKITVDCVDDIEKNYENARYILGRCGREKRCFDCSCDII